MNNPIQFNATVSQVYHKADNSVKVSFVTALEFDAAGYMAFHRYRQTEVDVLLSPALAPPDAPVDSVDTFSGEKPKTPSQQLRGALWHLWHALPDAPGEFETYYRAKMQTLRRAVLDEIDATKQETRNENQPTETR